MLFKNSNFSSKDFGIFQQITGRITDQKSDTYAILNHLLKSLRLEWGGGGGRLDLGCRDTFQNK